MGEMISKAFSKIKTEFEGYSKNVKIALYIMMFFTAGFVIFGIQILFWGLGYTDMSNLYPFGQWLSLIHI